MSTIINMSLPLDVSGTRRGVSWHVQWPWHQGRPQSLSHQRTDLATTKVQTPTVSHPASSDAKLPESTQELQRTLTTAGSCYLSYKSPCTYNNSQTTARTTSATNTSAIELSPLFTSTHFISTCTYYTLHLLFLVLNKQVTNERFYDIKQQNTHNEQKQRKNQMQHGCVK